MSENAFGHLKARWRQLLKQNDMSMSNVPNVVIACCILCNVCEAHQEAFNKVWLDDVHSDHSTSATNVITSSEVEDIRITLVQYYSS